MRFGFFLLLTLLAPQLFAQSYGDPYAEPQGFYNPEIHVKTIRITGTERIPEETIHSYLTFSKGDKITRDDVDLSLKALFATELFADVKIDVLSSGIHIIVAENPVINRIVLQGNKKIKEDKILGELQSRTRNVYTRSRVQADVERLIEIYRQSGRFGAKVRPYVIKRPQNRVDLIFKIDEGETTKVHRISFLGNKKYTDGFLKEVIKTRESAWWRFLSSDDTYDPGRVEYDKELLREFYLDQGFAEFRVKSAVAELSPEKTGFYITFTIEEGEPYTVNQVNVISQIKEVPSEALMCHLKTKKGDLYSATLVNRTVNKITDVAGEYGYAFVDVRPQTELNRACKLIDITYNLGEGPKVFVERINIVGNFRTLDKVIRREFRLSEGDAFNADKVKTSEKRLRNLGIFEGVKIMPEEGSTPDQTVINVEIEEKRTLDFNIAGGFSASDSILGKVELKESNFLGRGQELGASIQISRKRREFNVSFIEPYFMERDLMAGIDLFFSRTNFHKESSYDIDNAGGSFRIGYDLAPNIGQIWSYTYRRTKLFNIDSYASRIVLNTRKRASISEIGHHLTFDYRDNRIDPRRGFFLDLSQDFAGLGGGSRYIRFVNSAGYYYPLSDNLVGLVKAECGFIRGIKQELDINNRFYIGGDSLRGFEIGGIGPRDLGSLDVDALGGRRYALATVEFKFPLGLPEELGVTGRVFTDFGSLDDSGEKGSTIRDRFFIRAASGFGITWVTPMGPIRLDYSIPWRKEKFDITKNFLPGFGMGR